ncbi:hypothetical protein BOTBODRAFT_50992 [Botryobasidium botryosum FD-172 SS1]|uniref:MI domain-containing protein n=1 Tax=Botryobasidium botryosum (strain FD-172 SS1) TaxID=930990 RepID=A0A067NB22_BOTB1|nr:hypothetical protein BOTBODRAFT_50992 [Botryobasidium botryosum FD-172 SS1]
MDLDKIDASPESDSDTDEAPLLLDPDEENSDASEDADEGSEDSEDGVEEDEDEDEDDSQADSQDGDETIKGTEEDGSGDDQLGHSDRSSRTEDLATPSASGAVKTSGSLYVPPHLRHAKTSETSDDVQVTEAQKKLSRQLQGLLNRLSEQNIESILGEIQSIYRKNPRNDVTTALTTLILNSISLRASILDTFVIQHAALVSGLHKITGVDFAAYFLQTLVKSYEQHHAALRSSSASAAEDGGEAPSEGKECMNLLVLLSELYNFQVISCVLAYDIIRDLLAGDLSEFDVELLLKMLRNSGSQLRQDDPLALKDIIQIVHAKVADKDPRSMSSRVRFMLETLSNLKNNKVKKNAGQNTGGDAVERLKKFVSGLSKKHQILAHEPLHVSLADLRSAGTKGKWWLVGSAWAGDPLAENKTAFDKTAYLGSSEKGEANALVKLARKQGMNTDVRRSIFVVLMSSDDYVDACERLGQLGLTELQQREIIRVILHCCGNEKVYNPYYTLVAQHLCNSSHSYKITLQYCLWDFLRDLGESDVGGADIVNQDNAKSFDIKSISPTRIQNLAKAYAWWVAKGSSSLTIFKPVDFVKLQPQTRVFFQTFFAQLFVSNQASTPALDFTSSGPEPPRNREALEAVMTKALHSSTLSRGIVYFLSRTALEDLAQSKEMKKLLKWGVEVATESLRMGMDVGGER